MARKKTTKRPRRKPARKKPASASPAPSQKTASTAAKQSAARRRAEYRRKHSAEQSRTDAASIRDIGELPSVEDPDRRIECLRDLQLFNETYFPQRFDLAWSDDHIETMRLMELVAFNSESFAIAMERSGGKTTLCETLCLFAMLGGYHLFLAMFGANSDNAEAMSLSVQGELEENDLLLADFPEVCFPIRKLEGIVHRAKGQTYLGQRTRIGWQTKDVTLPSIKPAAWDKDKKLKKFLRANGYSVTSGVGYKCRGIESGARGMKRRLAGGRQIRPTMAIVDDPQTDASADSDKQTNDRMRIIKRTIRRLAGPGKKTAIVVPCTVIREGDLADRLLDHDANPEFHGKRFKALYAFPSNMDMWEGHYDRLRREGLSEVGLGKIDAADKLKKATAYYRRNRRKMDAGARVAWPDLFNKEEGEISGLQRCMNLFLEDRGAFMAESQNDPETEVEQVDDVLKPDAILTKINGYDRCVIPDGCERLVAFIDVQARLLYYAVGAFALDFTGAVIEYGSFPDQRLGYFTYAQARRTLNRKYKGASVESRIFRGLIEGIDSLAPRRWTRADGTQMTLDLLLVDSRYKKQSVFSACRQTPHAGLVMPAQGLYIGARHTPLAERKKKSGRVSGPWWYVEPDEEFRMRRLTIDANMAKTNVHARLSQADGEAGALRFYGKANGRKVGITHHQMIADQLGGSETANKTFGHGRELYEWTLKPSKPDNHFFDCVAGLLTAASAKGCQLPTDKPRSKPRRKRRKQVTYL